MAEIIIKSNTILFEYQHLLIAFALAAFISVIAFYKKWLNAGGAFAATCMGAIVWLAGGWQTAIPLLVFFVSGSVFGKLKGTQNNSDSKHSKPRDLTQVLCNGGVATICLLLFIFTKEKQWQLAYYASIAISTADTWSSELGMYFKGRVIDIVRLKPLPAGLSGGVSWQGSAAGLAGSLLIAVIGFAGKIFGTSSLSAIAATGVAGMLFDSILGSLLQARYKLQNGRQTEFITNDNAGELEKGFAWITNDSVNLLSNIIVTAVFFEL